MAIRAIGFDFGETLATYAGTPLNWVALYRPALLRVAAALHVSPGESEFVAAETCLRKYNTRINPRTDEVSAREIFSEALARWAVSDPGQCDRAVETFFGFFQQTLVAYPDTLRALESLRAAGLRVGLLTDVPYGMPTGFVENDLQQTRIRPLLDAVLTSVDVGKRKPDPLGFRRLAEQLGVAPSEMAYVGNEPKDIDGARAAAMTSVLIVRSSERPEKELPVGAKPTAVISDLREVLSLV